MKKIKMPSKLKNTIFQYILNNSKEYILVLIIFIIGIFAGVMFINNCSEAQESTVTSYINEFIEKFKTLENLDKQSLTVTSIKSNILLALIIWLAGTTIIGMSVVLGFILFRGFCLGYTVSAISLTIGTGKSLLFCLCGLAIQNVLFIPAILTMGVSSIRLYKAIINDRRKENIKIEIARHSVISSLMLGVLMASSVLECEISIVLLKFGVTKGMI